MSKLNQLKNAQSDREKILVWLSSIGETEQQCIDEVIEQCKADPEARAYYVARHDEDVLGIHQSQLHLVDNAA